MHVVEWHLMSQTTSFSCKSWTSRFACTLYLAEIHMVSDHKPRLMLKMYAPQSRALRQRIWTNIYKLFMHEVELGNLNKCIIRQWFDLIANLSCTIKLHVIIYCLRFSPHFFASTNSSQIEQFLIELLAAHFVTEHWTPAHYSLKMPLFSCLEQIFHLSKNLWRSDPFFGNFFH